MQVAKKQAVTSPSSPVKSKRPRVRQKSMGLDRSMSDQSESDVDISTRPDEFNRFTAADDCVIIGGSTDTETTSSGIPFQQCNLFV